MISLFLFKGKENAQTGKYLSGITGMTLRQLTNAIEEERRNGIPICACTGKKPGYYIASNKQEMEDYCNNLKHRAIEIFKTRKACKQTIESFVENEL